MERKTAPSEASVEKILEGFAAVGLVKKVGLSTLIAGTAHNDHQRDNSSQQRLANPRVLARRDSQIREMQRILLDLGSGVTIKLSPGGQNTLIEKVLNEFCPRFTPGGKPAYVGDTHKKWAYFDPEYLSSLGVTVQAHGKIPDIVVHFTKKNWLVLIEAVTSHGPVSPKRLTELKARFDRQQSRIGVRHGISYTSGPLEIPRRDRMADLGLGSR